MGAVGRQHATLAVPCRQGSGDQEKGAGLLQAAVRRERRAALCLQRAAAGLRPRARQASARRGRIPDRPLPRSAGMDRRLPRRRREPGAHGRLVDLSGGAEYVPGDARAWPRHDADDAAYRLRQGGRRDLRAALRRPFLRDPANRLADGEFRQAGSRAAKGCRLWRPLGPALRGPVGETSKEETDMPRVPPITGKSDVPAQYHAVVDDVVGVFGQIRGPFSMLLHSPKLAEKMRGLVKFNRDESIVEPQLRSVGILASVREREAAYVWAGQVGAARRAGVPEATIDLLRAKGDPAKLPPDERNIVTYVRQLVRSNRVDQPVFDALKNRHGEQWLVELTVIAHYFGVLSGVVNAFEVPAPPDGDKLPG